MRSLKVELAPSLPTPAIASRLWKRECAVAKCAQSNEGGKSARTDNSISTAVQTWRLELPALAIPREYGSEHVQ